jgi:hypothetical protein
VGQPVEVAADAGAGETTAAVGEEAAAIAADVTLTHTVCPTVMLGGRYPGLERNAVRYAIRTLKWMPEGRRTDAIRTLGGRVAGRQRGGKTIAPKGCAGA